MPVAPATRAAVIELRLLLSQPAQTMGETTRKFVPSEATRGWKTTFPPKTGTGALGTLPSVPTRAAMMAVLDETDHATRYVVPLNATAGPTPKVVPVVSAMGV